MANKFPLILNTSANQIQEIASGDNLDLTGCGINNAGVITATSFSGNGSGLIGVASTDYIVTGTAATFNNTTNFNGNVNISSNIDVDGHTNLDNVSIAGVTTMSGDITISNTSPKISLVDTNNNDDFDLMNADGIFQIVDATNSANRLRIDSTGTVNVPGNLDVGAGVDVTGNVVASGNVSGVDGTFTGNVSIGGTLTYEDVTNIDSVGLITARNGINVSAGTATFQGAIDANSDLDVDGHTNLDNVSIAGVVTISSAAPNLLFTETDANPDWGILCSGGQMKFQDMTATANIFTLDDDKVQAVKNLDALAGVDVTGNITATGSIDLAGDIDVDGHTNLDNVSIAGVTTFQNDLNLGDSDILRIGNSSDLQLYHDGNSHVSDRGGTGELWIESNNTVSIKQNDASHYMAKFNQGGSVTLSYNNSTKFSTTNTGAQVSGILTATSFKLEDGSNVGGVDSDAQYNTVGGTNSGDGFTGNNAEKNTLFGYDTGTDISSGDNNTCMGYRSGEDISTGGSNTLIGSIVGERITTTGDNTGVGFMCMAEVTGGNNTAMGSYALKDASDCTGTVAIGNWALYSNAGGDYNIGVGYDACRGNYSNPADYKIGIGYQALRNARGDYNIGIGYRAGSDNNGNVFNTGTHNITIGHQSGQLLSSGSNNTIMGPDAGDVLASGSNNLILGHDAAASSASVSNEITLGDANITKFRVPGIGLELTGPVGLTTEQVTPSSNVATLNLAKDDHKIVASGTYTVNVSGGTEAGSHTLRIENSGTANVGFSTYFKFPSGGTPSLPTASGAISLISFTVHKVGSVGIATVLLAGASVNYS